jgi:3alpha(or 20beta)-hydroxysteroid dehydrogenase
MTMTEALPTGGRLAGKVAVITGAARGQGAAEARLFAEHGAAVVLTDVLEKEGEELARDLGERAVFCRQDVADEGGWNRVVDATAARFGRLDVLVNNAAVLHLAALEDTLLRDFQRVLDVNLVGPFLGMRACAPLMRQSGGGSIINVSSVDGIVGMNGVAAYSSSKFGVRGLTRVGALELGKYGIRVNTLHPGGVDTAMQGGEDLSADQKNAFFADHPIPRVGRPDELAYVALFLASDESSYCTGAEFVADGGQITGSRVMGAPGY